MFDPEGEVSFISQSKDLLEERTVILITHRPASLALADRIVEMELKSEIPVKNKDTHKISL
jgi:ABC-type bacteriocin/lantibiotic exporter with double-glycine peptidase domain